MKSCALTALFVKNARTPGSYFDGRGLLLRVDDKGNRKWVLRVSQNGCRRELGLGSASEVSLQDARENAARLREASRNGTDVIVVHRTERKTVPTFAQAARTLHGQSKVGWKNSKHAAQWLTTLENHAFHLIGETPVSMIALAHVHDILSPIWVRKPETARRLRQRIRAVLEWSRVAGFRDETSVNPADAVVAGLPKQKRRDNHFVAMPYEDVPAFVSALRMGNRSVTKLGLEFLILTCARTGEVLGATWPEFNLDAGVWTIPAQRMKAEREHRVPLTARAIEVLREAGVLNPQATFVFPGLRAGQASNMTFLTHMRRLGLTATPHGFRSSFRDWAAETTSHANHVVEMALAHAVGDKVEAAYRRGDLFEKRRLLMEEWTRYLGNETPSKPSAKSSAKTVAKTGMAPRKAQSKPKSAHRIKAK